MADCDGFACDLQHTNADNDDRRSAAAARIDTRHRYEQTMSKRIYRKQDTRSAEILYELEKWASPASCNPRGATHATAGVRRHPLRSIGLRGTAAPSHPNPDKEIRVFSHHRNEEGGDQVTAPIPAAWAYHAEELAGWAIRLRNRKDFRGGYRPKSERTIDPKTGRPRVAYTAPGALTYDRLVAHFIGADQGDLVGLHVASPAETCKFVVVDFDAHKAGDNPEANRKMAVAIYAEARSLALDALLLDSNGSGGFHVWIIFRTAVPMADAWRLGKWLVRDYRLYGLTRPPESFPKGPRLTAKRIGHFVRLPGRHHTREHWTRVWDGQRWLEGAGAIRAILAVEGADVDLERAIPADIGSDPMGEDRRQSRVVAMPLDGRDRERDVALAREALQFLGDDHRDYEAWLRIGMALSELGEDGRKLWHEWSRSCDKYDPAALDEKWASFAAGEGVGLGTLFYLAKEEGWPGPSKRGEASRRPTVSFTLRPPKKGDTA